MDPSSTLIPLGARTDSELPVSVTSLEKVRVTALGAVVIVELMDGSAEVKSNAKAGRLVSAQILATTSVWSIRLHLTVGLLNSRPPFLR